MNYFLELIATKSNASWKWFSERAHSKHAAFWLGFVSFFEPICIPFFSEGLLAPLVLARPDLARRYTFIAVIFSVMGAVVTYLIAATMFGVLIEPYLQHNHLMGAFHGAQRLLLVHHFSIIFAVAFLPLPDKVFIYGAGFLGLGLVPFTIAFALGRGLRMGLVSFLVARFGAPALRVLNKYMVWATLALAGIVVVWYGVAMLPKLAPILPW